jgi:hypothetical protein
VAFHNPFDTPSQSQKIEGPFETQHDGKIIERTVRFQLIEKPQPLLSKGERQSLIPPGGNQCRRSLQTSLVDFFCKGRYGRRFK